MIGRSIIMNQVSSTREIAEKAFKTREIRDLYGENI